MHVDFAFCIDRILRALNLFSDVKPIFGPRGRAVMSNLCRVVDDELTLSLGLGYPGCLVMPNNMIISRFNGCGICF
jgi:hypothetical protein